MPYESAKQSRYIHAKANEGVGWAKRFVKHSHGTHVKKAMKRKMKHG